MAPGTPCLPRGQGAALLLVPYDEVEEVFVDMGLLGEQGVAQLLAAMAEGAGEVEIFVAARGAEGAVSWGGEGGLCLGQGSQHPGVHPTMGQTLPQRGGEDGGAAQAGLGKGAAPGRGCRTSSPRPHRHMPLRIPSHRGLPGPGGALPCGRCRATIRGGLRGAGGQGMPAFPRLPALFGASHQGEYIKDRTKARGPRRGGCCRCRCLARPPRGWLLLPARSPAGPRRGDENGYGHRGTQQRSTLPMWGEGSPAPLHQGHLSHPRGGSEPRSDAAAPGICGVGMGEHGRARRTRSRPEAPASAGSECPSPPAEHQHPHTPALWEAWGGLALIPSMPAEYLGQGHPPQ